MYYCQINVIGRLLDFTRQIGQFKMSNVWTSIHVVVNLALT